MSNGLYRIPRHAAHARNALEQDSAAAVCSTERASGERSAKACEANASGGNSATTNMACGHGGKLAATGKPTAPPQQDSNASRGSSMATGTPTIPPEDNLRAKTEAANRAKIEIANTVKVKMTLSKLHRCLGHISPATARDIVRLGMVEGIDLDMHSKAKFCEPCVQAKATRKPFPKKSLMRATRYGEQVFSNVWGPAQVQTIGGRLYYVTFTDDSTHETMLYLIQKKSQTFDAYLDYEAWAKQHHGGATNNVLETGPGLGGATIGTLDTD
ncbi:Retrovirus-related Pol polyprotein from transposon TNT 1-94 [Mycena venus]|uniref:Retrovirus-related Pol polyprotein from transposon TNT 1-94 n=1 Tax=Mycena venus TaxID=2733690 RepID=A0A8H6Z8Z8_9AGAR|nr:Retrovirus-related Pol polyprotein from transposon TNT 1-94 [Mycena venus]